MKISGSAMIPAARERVWAALQDPATLAATIPGCRGLEEIGTDTYAMTISAGVAAIRGSYRGQVALEQPHPPETFVLRASGQGAPGTVEATVRITLSPESPEGGVAATRVDYDADAVVGGMVGGVGQRVIAGVAKKTAAEFFAAVTTTLTAPSTPGAAAPGTAVSADAVSDAAVPAGSATTATPTGTDRSPDERPAARYVSESAQAPDRIRAGAVLAGVAIGALATLAGVAAGAVLAGRRSTGR